MPTFAEYEARRKAANGSSDAEVSNDDTPSSMYHPGLGDDAISAAEHELLRTGKEAAIGLARSPLDMVKSFLHPVDTLKGVAHTVAHPIDTAHTLMDNPRDAGSVLGQLLLAPKLPGAAESTVAKGPGIAGRGVSAVGRGMEAVGTSPAARTASKLGAVGAVLHGDIPGAALAMVPKALEVGGQYVQKGGAALEGLKLSLKRPPTMPVDDPIDPEAAAVRETVKTARGLRESGMKPGAAAQRAGWPLGKSSAAPSYPSEPVSTDLFPYQSEQLANGRSARSIDALAERARDWSKDASAQPDTPDIDSRITGLPPDASDADLSPLDQLSRLSSARRTELLKKFGGAGT